MAAVLDLLALLGVHPQPLFWALAGATLGMSMAPAAGPVRTWTVFVCVVLLSTLLGMAGAARWAEGSLTTADTIAALTAWLFHPVASAVVAMVPQAIAGWVQRWSAGAGKVVTSTKPEGENP